MCEANVYFHDKEGKESLILESVDRIVPTEEGVLLESIFSERKMVKGKIKEMILAEHRVVLEDID
ncbi:MAG: CooT family nickel-binding protein [Firmicutes bacterium]|nr:CooT family nickel-binding protein [Bacillota bacterium]